MAGPTPFRLSSSSWLAVLRSTGPVALDAAPTGVLAVVFAGPDAPAAGAAAPAVTRGVIFAMVAFGTPAASRALATSAPAG